jgi:hypothetical protein
MTNNTGTFPTGPAQAIHPWHRATALAQATAAGMFTATHQRYWVATRRARGDAAGTKALIEILLAHRTVPTNAVKLEA